MKALVERRRPMLPMLRRNGSGAGRFTCRRFFLRRAAGIQTASARLSSDRREPIPVRSKAPAIFAVSWPGVYGGDPAARRVGRRRVAGTALGDDAQGNSEQ